MPDHSYSVEVQSDFLEKITRAKPIQALAELIWNSLDADATAVHVTRTENLLGGLSAITITDNGTGIDFTQAPELFRKLGGSWKRPGGTTVQERRFLHGQDGRGRFKAFALGTSAQWDVTHKTKNSLATFNITMSTANIRKVTISDPQEAPHGRTTGVTLTISEPLRDYPTFAAAAEIQEFAEIFALYLSDYRDVSITVEDASIDPSKAIASRGIVPLSDLVDEDGAAHPARLEIIEWHSATNRSLYLCNEKRFPLAKVERRFHVGNYQFSAYLQSSYVSKLQNDGLLELAEMRPEFVALLDQTYQAIKSYFRERAAQESRSIIEDWKLERVYPYEGEAKTQVQKVERQVFDIVAVNVAQYLPDFSSTPPKNKALHLRLLRQAIEKSPEDLQLILGEVLKLPKRKQEELAGLLRDVSLSAIISAAKIVADRLKFLFGLEAVLFGADTKNRLKERSQLHQIVKQNCWLFGEEYNLSVDDQSLTEVLRKHRKILGDDTVIDEPVRHVTKERGIVDLVLSRSIRRHKAADLTHLVVELKSPKVKVKMPEINQIEGYALSVMNDERFRAGAPTWVFWVISDDYDDFAKFRITDPHGKIHEKDNSSIWVKTWGQILDENRARLQFFQERLEYQADKGASLEYLQERYAEFLKGVFVEESEDESATETPE